MLKENNQRNSLDYGQKSRHIYVDKRTVCNEVRVHWHSYFELEFIIDGSAAHFLNDKEYAVHRGSVYVLNPTDFAVSRATKESSNTQSSSQEMFISVIAFT